MGAEGRMRPELLRRLIVDYAIAGRVRSFHPDINRTNSSDHSIRLQARLGTVGDWIESRDSGCVVPSVLQAPGESEDR